MAEYINPRFNDNGITLQDLIMYAHDHEIDPADMLIEVKQSRRDDDIYDLAEVIAEEKLPLATSKHFVILGNRPI